MSLIICFTNLHAKFKTRLFRLLTPIIDLMWGSLPLAPWHDISGF